MGQPQGRKEPSGDTETSMKGQEKVQSSLAAQLGSTYARSDGGIQVMRPSTRWIMVAAGALVALVIVLLAIYSGGSGGNGTGGGGY